ncbi:MAG: MerR family transcriptional regulator [Chloroherpetonaceae bacterium]|nr:MerR family transcriptional regulator [Chloroherpetonaceae bacterium]
MKTFQAKKIYYSISEVSRITKVPAYLLRYWESEFPILSPSRNSQGNRIYTNKDVAIVLSIKNLIQDEGFTLEKAKSLLLGKSVSSEMIDSTNSLLEQNREELKINDKLMSERLLKRKKKLIEAKEMIEEMLKILR